MESTSERNRLRTVGRIPQETRDYLSAKKRDDGKLRAWEIPVFAIQIVLFFFLIALLARGGEPSRHPIPLLTSIFLITCTLLQRIRRLIV